MMILMKTIIINDTIFWVFTMCQIFCWEVYLIFCLIQCDSRRAKEFYAELILG